MSESAQALRAAAAILLAKASELDGQGAVAFDPNNWRTWWPSMQEQYRKDDLTREWRDWTTGMDPTQAGDNTDTPETDDFMRAFGQMMTHAGMAHNSFRDSTGAVFFAPTIRKRGGWPELKKEVKRMVLSEWGKEWMAHPLNANLVPKAGAIVKLMGG